ncbi:hypothetical protein GCM10018952_19420 [Streptosporangium vulgare]
MALSRETFLRDAPRSRQHSAQDNVSVTARTLAGYRGHQAHHLPLMHTATPAVGQAVFHWDE